MQTSGFLVVNKPQGLTSRDVVNRAARWFPNRTRLGHGGTLDPLATGVLVLAYGQATRLLEYVQRSPKTYTTAIILGADSDTDDADGVVTPRENVTPASEEQIRSVLATMIGNVTQTPPAFSAAKVAGQRAYALARKGEEVELAPRIVRIDSIVVLEFAWPTLRLRIDCGKGTYIRSVARDLGNTLGTGGYVTALHRDRIGDFTLDNAVTVDATKEEALAAARPITAPLTGIPQRTVSAEEARRIRFGQIIKIGHPNVEELAVTDPQGELVALGQVVSGGFKPLKVIPVEG